MASTTPLLLGSRISSRHSRTSRYSKYSKHSRTSRYSRSCRHSRTSRYSRYFFQFRTLRYSRSSRHFKTSRYSRSSRHSRIYRSLGLFQAFYEFQDFWTFEGSTGPQYLALFFMQQLIMSNILSLKYDPQVISILSNGLESNLRKTPN